MNPSTIVVTFRKRTCAVLKARYRNGQTALILNDLVTGERIAVASVALDVAIAEDHVLINTWSENEGILPALVNGGIVIPTGIRHPSGNSEALECTLLI